MWKILEHRQADKELPDYVPFSAIEKTGA